MTAYWRERFPLSVFGPVAAWLALAATGGRLTLNGWLGDCLFALCLLAQFRLWDDLADRERDAMRHPDRVLTRASNLANYEVACTALGLANLLTATLRDPGFAGVALVAALDAAFLVWYEQRTVRNAAGDLFLLTKYPIFVAAIAIRTDIRPAALAAGMAATYAGACVFEAWHDPSGPLRPGRFAQRRTHAAKGTGLERPTGKEVWTWDRAR